MVNFNYDGSYPLDRLTMKGYTFRKCTIRNWTTHNRRIASKRRCHHLLEQLPRHPDIADFSMRVNTEIPQKIELVELEIKAAILNGDFGKLQTNHTMKVPCWFGT